jgi:hydrogenase/urease accessory protein HupE
LTIAARIGRAAGVSLKNRLARLTCAWLIVTAGAALAHPLAPSLLELREERAGVYAVRWKTPLLRAPGVELRPVLPDACRSVSEMREEVGPADLQVFWKVDCSPVGLTGTSLEVEGLGRSRTAALIRIEMLDGHSLSGLVRSDAPRFLVEPDPEAISVFSDFAVLGVEHILLGPDHLLFVLGLLLLVRQGRALLGAITCFTLGHSITLVLASLEVVTLPSGLVEIGIALSLVVVAVELCRRSESGHTFIGRRPWSASFGFGLLHGMGFAAAMREAGLPSSEIPLALFSFNLGIELGQLLFIALVLVVMKLSGLGLAASPRIRWLSAYAIGSLAVYWIIERSIVYF